MRSPQKKSKNFKLCIGTRVKHKTNENLKEGVIVWVHSHKKGVIPELDGKIYSVFWSNNTRGVYRSDEIEKNNQKAIINFSSNEGGTPNDQ
ncbi:MAG: hypothetical protein NZZ41_04840 [Candidatus Dojkabacteria bacterium]|nr:hypothetical protein [Candidatus Dojkabacteria bacterium]